MKRFTLFLGLIAAIGFGSFSVMAQDANSGAGGHGHGFGHNRLRCFSGTEDETIYGGTCTLTGHGARKSAILNTADGDPDGSYAGVYTNSRYIYGRPLSAAGQLSFRFTGSPASAGSPRFSVPIDTDGDGDTDVWAYISAFYCNDGSGNVSGNNSGCTIYTSDNGAYAGVAALTAAYPGAKIATDDYVFVVSDEPGIWTISKVKFGQPGNGN